MALNEEKKMLLYNTEHVLMKETTDDLSSKNYGSPNQGLGCS